MTKVDYVETPLEYDKIEEAFISLTYPWQNYNKAEKKHIRNLVRDVFSYEPNFYTFNEICEENLGTEPIDSFERIRRNLAIIKNDWKSKNVNLERIILASSTKEPAKLYQ